MGTIADKLSYLEETRTQIAQAITNKGVAVSGADTFRSYAAKVGQINTAKPEETKTVPLSMATGNQLITPTNGKVMTQVSVEKPATMLPENIKKGVDVGGVLGTMEAGAPEKVYTIVVENPGDGPCIEITYIDNNGQKKTIGSRNLGAGGTESATTKHGVISVYTDEGEAIGWVELAIDGRHIELGYKYNSISTFVLFDENIRVYWRML